MRISDYHDHPFAIFCYDPKDEFKIRKEVQLLKTRLKSKKKDVFILSLAEIFWEILENEDLESIFKAEIQHGLESMVDTIHNILSSKDIGYLEDKIKLKIPTDLHPDTIIFITRVGVLYPVYRASTILSNLNMEVQHITLLFYPGKAIGNYGLSLMGLYEPSYDYREKKY